MLSAAQVEQFKADRFVRGGRVLDDDQVRPLCDELSRVIRDKDNHDVTQPVRFFNISGNDAAPILQILNIWTASDAFRQLIDMPVIVLDVSVLTDALVETVGREALPLYSDWPEHNKHTTEEQGFTNLECLSYSYDLTGDRKYVDAGPGLLARALLGTLSEHLFDARDDTRRAQPDPARGDLLPRRTARHRTRPAIRRQLQAAHTRILPLLLRYEGSRDRNAHGQRRVRAAPDAGTDRQQRHRGETPRDRPIHGPVTQNPAA